MTQDPSLAEALRQTIEARLLDLHVSTPAGITAYDASTQKVSAQPLIMRAYIDEEGDRQVEPVPVVQDVPVQFPGSGLANGMTFPIAAGDYCTLLFSEQATGQWLVRGGSTPVDPADDRKHSLSDGVALCGLNSFSSPIPNVSSSAVVIRAASALLLGDATATEATIKLTSFMSALNTLLAAIATAVGTSGTPAGATAAGTAITTAVSTFNGLLSSFTTQKVKVF